MEETNEAPPGSNGNGISENSRPIASSGYGNDRPVLEVVTALYAFDASNSEELSFRKGKHLLNQIKI